MDRNIIKIKPFDKLLFCTFDVLIPFASLHQLTIVANETISQYISRGILPIVLLVVLAISMLAFFQRKRECEQCLVMDDNVLHICSEKSGKLSVIKTIPIQQDAKFVAKGTRGIFIEQGGSKTKVLNHSVSIYMLIWSILFVASFWTLLFLIKTPYELIENCNKLNTYYNPDFVKTTKNMPLAIRIILNIIRLMILGFFAFCAIYALLFIFSKIAIFF